MSVKEVVSNKKAYHLYQIKDKIEAGLVLIGSEVKSLRAGRCHLKDSYVSFKGDELFLQKAHISPYKFAENGGHEPERLRKLLLSRQEIEKIMGFIRQKKMTCIPLRIYFKKGRAKVEIGLAIGKTLGDKRESAKKKTSDRQMERAVRRNKRF